MGPAQALGEFRLEHGRCAATARMVPFEEGVRASDVVPISEARARLTELAEDVVGKGTEKLLTKNGASYVALPYRCALTST